MAEEHAKAHDAGHKEHAHEHGHAEKKQKVVVKPIYAIAIVVAVVLIGAYLAFGSVGAQTVAAGDTVEVNYTGTFLNGTVFDASSYHGSPLQFVVGAGQVIPGFDQGVIGMSLYQNRTLTIPPSEAYGYRSNALIVSVPITLFANQSGLQVGMHVTKSANGTTEQGTITALNSSIVTVDFNPPLAGQTLVFRIEVVGIKK
ncbi:MAG: peptidylprolyl isomerase [Candidatus Micrarchaeota archaeon]|nr:peptidylprolyl isomerase [Candidatus Micrarchaeota archaeon]